MTDSKPLKGQWIGNKGQYKGGWWVKPNKEISSDVFALHVYWVNLVGSELLAQIEAFRKAELAGDRPVESARIRGVIAADFSLLGFWLRRLRIIARRAEHQGKSLGPVVPLLGALRLAPVLQGVEAADPAVRRLDAALKAYRVLGRGPLEPGAEK